MKYCAYLTCLALALLTTGCFEMLEAIYVNADGSGKYELTVDLSGMFSDPMMGEMMKNGMQEETGRERLEIDSLISFADLQDGGLPATLTDRDRAVIDRTQLRMVMSESRQIGKFIMTFPFQEPSELDQFQQTFAKLNANEGENGLGGFMSGGAMFGGTSSWDFSGRTLRRSAVDADTPEMASDLDEGSLDMLKMMMQEATFTTIYHLPGKVKKASFKGAKIDGNTVRIEYNVPELLEDRPDMSGTVKFKSE